MKPSKHSTKPSSNTIKKEENSNYIWLRGKMWKSHKLSPLWTKKSTNSTSSWRERKTKSPLSQNDCRMKNQRTKPSSKLPKTSTSCPWRRATNLKWRIIPLFQANSSNTREYLLFVRLLVRFARKRLTNPRLDRMWRVAHKRKWHFSTFHISSMETEKWNSS